LPPTSDSDADGMSGHRLVPYKASCLWLQCNRNNNSPPVLSELAQQFGIEFQLSITLLENVHF